MHDPFALAPREESWTRLTGVQVDTQWGLGVDASGAVVNFDFRIGGPQFGDSPMMRMDTLDLPKDITAYELGVLLRTIVTAPACVVEQMPELVRRFFVAAK